MSMDEKISGRKLSMVCNWKLENHVVWESERLWLDLFAFFVFLEKISLITSEECIESNVIPVEAKKFLEEETANEVINNTSTAGDQDENEEDLVSEIYYPYGKRRFIVFVDFSLISFENRQHPL